MPKFITFFSFKPETVAAMIESPDNRVDAVRRLAEAAHGKLESYYWMQGQFDGFAIAEEDLRLRGPGEFAGTAQSGLASFRIADLVRDIAVYRDAKAAAESIVADDPELRAPGHAGLRLLVEGEPSTRAMLLSS